MTAKEAIKELQEAHDIMRSHDIDSSESRLMTALNMAIESLEQEPILDKIRAEIEQLTITKGGDDYVRKMAELFSLKMKVLQIIDKYKAESEDKEC